MSTKSLAKSLLRETNLKSYLEFSRRDAQAVAEHKPPTAEETSQLIEFLQAQGIKAAIMGSAAIGSYFSSEEKETLFRRTNDLDLFVNRAPKDLPPGWSRDTEAIGVLSFISPSGGYVDLMEGKHQLPDGRETDKDIEIDHQSKSYPIASATALFRMKLNSYRPNDLWDLVALGRKIGIPTNLGRLNELQKENLVLVQEWLNVRPTGTYGQ